MSREIAAEAAVWIARLHGPDRSRHLELECLAWQARSPANRLAFERGTDLWMDAAGVDRAAVERAAAAHRQQHRTVEEGASASRVESALRSFRLPRALALASAGTALAVLAAVMVHQPWRDIEIYDTRLGEQRSVVLKDGSRVTLNTSTRVQVEFDQARRSVRVDGGEALFEVAKEASRPFVVRAAGAEVTATGTAFLVRVPAADAGASAALEVTLVEGQVIVEGTGSAGNAIPGVTQPIVMAEGDRIRVLREPGSSKRSDAAVVAPRLDRPRVDHLLAWKRGEAIFDNVSLGEALTEMNRYSAVPITAGPGVAELRVSGSYRTGDNRGFARALSTLHGLQVQELAARIELIRE